MKQPKPFIARARELASVCPTNKILRLKLKHEGYTLSEINSHFEGKGFRSEVRQLRLAGQVAS